MAIIMDVTYPYPSCRRRSAPRTRWGTTTSWQCLSTPTTAAPSVSPRWTMLTKNNGKRRQWYGNGSEGKVQRTSELLIWWLVLLFWWFFKLDTFKGNPRGVHDCPYNGIRWENLHFYKKIISVELSFILTFLQTEEYQHKALSGVRFSWHFFLI